MTAVAEEQMAATGPMSMGEWRERARDVILRLAATGRPFTWNDVEEAGLPKAYTPRSAGLVVRGLRDEGFITPAGHAVSAKPVNKGAVVRIWRGTSLAVTRQSVGQDPLFLGGDDW